MIDQLGAIPLFLGVETASWTLSDFANAATQMKILGVTSLLVKVGDGTNRWYQSLGGPITVLGAIKTAGLSAVPYLYSYGDKFAGLDGEIAFLTELLQTTGIAIVDMEVEWNGQTTWATRFAQALKPVKGLLGITTWADPIQQNWQPLLPLLAPITDFWMPQVYSNFLGGVYQAQYAGYGELIPVLNLGSDFGANDVLTIAQQTKSASCAFWEYQAVSAGYSRVVAAIAQMKGGATVGIPAGWHDDGTTLTAPNGMNVVMGFRDYILSHSWDGSDWPLEAEHAQNPLEISNTSLGGGTQQVFRYSMLGWTDARGVFREWMGQELLALRAIKTPVIADAVTDIGNAVTLLQGVQRKLSS